jgi:uncharacterized membrane protein YdjX (TVP38/TMEM64 family)
MEFEAIFNDLFEIEHIMNLIRKYRSLGPFFGIMLTLAEAFLPFLPLFLFVVVNATAFGLWAGFFYSWIGACAGALIVFLLARKFGQEKMLSFVQKHSKVKKLMGWLDYHGFGPIFLLLCFPFTPSAVVNIVAGISKVRMARYMLAVLAGKVVMIFSISFIGHDLHSFFTRPERTVLVFLAIFILWYAGRKVEVQLNKRTKEKVTEGNTK